MQDHTPWYTPRGPEIIAQGGANFANSIGQGLQKLGDSIGAALQQRRERAKQELSLGKSAVATFKASPELQKTVGMPLEEFLLKSPKEQSDLVHGAIAGSGFEQGRQQERAQLAAALTQQQAAAQEVAANTAFDTAQSRAVGKNLLAALNQKQGPVNPPPVALEDLVNEIVRTPGAGRSQAGSRLLEQGLIESGKTARTGAPVVLPPGARATGFNVGPNGVTQQFSVDPDRAGEQPTQIFLKDGTPTQKAIYKDGTVIDLPADRAKALTDAQANALQFSERMAFNNNVLSQLERDGFDATGAGAAMQKWTPNVMTGEKFQQYDAARKNWIAAVLRKESGAAISKSEEKGALEQYFPSFGDAPSVVKQKAELRNLAETNMRRAIGGIENQAGAAATATKAQRFDTEAAARSGGMKAGDVIELYDPASATYRKARLK